MGEPLEKFTNKGYDEAANTIREWWSDLQDSKQAGSRATLRRARNPNEVSVQYEYFSLYKKMTDSKPPVPIMKKLSYRLPLVAGILSHVRIDDPDRAAAEKMGSSDKQGGDRPVVSDLRFRRLLRTEDDDEFYLMMIRMIRMLGNRVNVKDMAMSIFFWNDQARKKWASQYYLKKDIYLDNVNSEKITKGKGEK